MSKLQEEIVVVWQNHENRITKLEKSYENVTRQLEEVSDIVKQESEEQKALLNKLIDHHLETNKIKISKFWKFLINAVGTGGIIYLIVHFLLSQTLNKGGM